ncbi:MAG TPA: hypothetical protein PKK00_08630 [Bacteroidales bacterium]|nr:hypothetical protein [Bacteroidales bacterium]HPS17996.1 hypothetical protein [Bacteroidales bacterium]
MTVLIKEVKNKSDIKQFVNFQFDLYKNNKFWVPPIKSAEIKSLLPENPANDFCDSRFFLAFKNNKCVGRIGAIINKNYNEKVNQKFGRINRIEFIDDYEVSEKLINTAIEWFKEQQMEFVHGPLGYTNLDTQGLLIEGFDYLPSIASVYHLPYYKDHFEKLGFEKENDWIEFRMTITEEPLNKAKRGAEIVKKRSGVQVLNFTKRSELLPYSEKMFEILNDAFQYLPYVSPLNNKMIKLYSDKYFNILNPKFVKIVVKDSNPIGFFVGLPSLSVAMQKTKGKLFPFGFFHILKALKKPEVVDMLLTGVLQDFQNAGIAVILISELQTEMMKAGVNTLETTGVFETNQNVIANWKNYEHIQHKRRRCFVKKI